MHKYSSFFKGELYEGDEGYAFISYAHRDSNIVLPIVSRLYDNGLRVWFDDGIEAGSGKVGRYSFYESDILFINS